MLPDELESVLDVDRSSETRFADLALLTGLAGHAPDELDLEQERLNLAKAHDWFIEANLRGSHETSRTRPLEPQDDVVSWSGYGHAALGADALLMAEWRDRYGLTFANLEPTPTRVLDVGCGVYGQWIVAAAHAPGWEATRFVGLDLAPVLVPTSLLPPDVRSRVDFVQHDFLLPLPFPDGHFDYIRCCGVTAGVPEPSWDPLIEEFKRCLAPGGTLEIADTPARPTLPLRLREQFDTILEKQLLNVNLRGIIPATLAMNDMHDIVHTRVQAIPNSFSSLVQTSLVAGPKEAQVKARVLLASLARYTASHAASLARTITRALASDPPQVPPSSEGAVGGGLGLAAAAQLRDQSECESRIRNGTAEWNKLASISALMAQQWGWTCRVDEEMATQLNDHLRMAEERLLEATQAASASEEDSCSPGNAHTDQREELRVAQQKAEARRREVTAQLQAVRDRLETSGNARSPGLDLDMPDIGGEA